MRSTVPVLVCLCVPVPSPSVFLPAMLKRSVVRPYRYARPHECRRAGNRCGRASGCESRFCPSLRGLAKQSSPRSRLCSPSVFLPAMLQHSVAGGCESRLRDVAIQVSVPGYLLFFSLVCFVADSSQRRKGSFFGFFLPARSLSSFPVCLPARNAKA